MAYQNVQYHPEDYFGDQQYMHPYISIKRAKCFKPATTQYRIIFLFRFDNNEFSTREFNPCITQGNISAEEVNEVIKTWAKDHETLTTERVNSVIKCMSISLVFSCICFFDCCCNPYCFQNKQIEETIERAKKLEKYLDDINQTYQAQGKLWRWKLGEHPIFGNGICCYGPKLTEKLGAQIELYQISTQINEAPFLQPMMMIGGGQGGFGGQQMYGGGQQMYGGGHQMYGGGHQMIGGPTPMIGGGHY